MEGTLVLAVTAFALVYLFFMRRRRSRQDANLRKLLANFKADRIFDKVGPAVAISLSSRELGIAGTDIYFRMPFADIIRWEAKWVEQSNNGRLSTQDHFVHITTSNLNRPLLKVKCLSKAMAEELSASLDAAVNA